MNYTETENWIRESIIKNGSFTLNTFAKGAKVFETTLSTSQQNYDLTELNGYLKKVGKSLKKVKTINAISWFKTNLIDNAVSDLVGIGNISKLEDLQLLSSLIKYDKADQNGDVIVGVFDYTKTWLIKLTHNQSEHRVYIRLYGTGKIIELLCK